MVGFASLWEWKGWFICVAGGEATNLRLSEWVARTVERLGCFVHRWCGSGSHGEELAVFSVIRWC